MKLPTAKFPGKLREMKLISVKPLRRLSYTLRRKLKKKPATSPSTIPNIGKANFSQAGSVQGDVRDSKGFKLLLNLLLVRPWVLVLGFWLLSMGVGTLALNGMLSPRKLRMAVPEPPATEAEDTRSSLLNVEQAAGEEAIEGDAAGDAIAFESGAASDGSNFPLLPITALVGSCAMGSLIISRRRAMARLAAARAKGRVRKGRPVSSAAVHSTAHSKVRSAPASLKSSVKSPVKNAGARGTAAKGQKGTGKAGGFSFKAASEKSSAAVRSLKPKKRRQRSKPLPTAAQASVRNRVLASRTNAQKNVKSARPQTRVMRSQARRAAAKQAGRRQPIVSVVPANESHALDWPNSSLAHQMDIRQQRSAM
ncbi:MAG: hypothetical protein AAFY54_13840 [Cyanobacteria bacterium J06648_10]